MIAPRSPSPDRLTRRLLALATALIMAMGWPDGVAAATGPNSESRNPAPTPVGEVKFSHQRGLYDAPFRLHLSSRTRSAVIRYTLDGSEPTATTGKVYAAPLDIARTTVLRAAAFEAGRPPARTKTHTFLFPADVVEQSPDGLPPEGFPFQWGQNQVDYGMDPRVTGDPASRAELLAGLRSLPSVSLVADLESLFGAARGVYSNPGEQGRASERECSLEYLPAGGGRDFQIDCGMRMRGGFSRMPINPKHALRLFFRDEYGAGKLKYPLFGPDGARSFDSFDLRTFQNYSWSLGGDHRGIFLRDQFHRDLQLAMGQPAARGEFCHLYLNGQYWGLYNTCERPEASFAASYFGGRKEDYDVVKVDSGFTTRESTYELIATDGSLEPWRRLYARAAAGLADPAAYFALQGRNADGTPNPALGKLLEVDNLIDYMLLIFWGGNLDAPISAFGDNRNPNNFHAIRPKDGSRGFRFFIWDAEHTLLDVNEDRTGPFRTGERAATSSPQWLWQQCVENAEFRLQVADRVERHFSPGGLLSPASLTNRFLARARQIEAAVLAESARWGDVRKTFEMGTPPRLDDDGRPVTGPLGRADWRREIQRLLTRYFPQRSDRVRSQLFAHGLLPDLATPRWDSPDGRAWTATHPDAGAVIHYTIDGSDPRQVGGAVSPQARRYEGPVRPPAGTPFLRARAWRQGDWSALAEVPGPR
ncbi:MAG: CotH kinase family protein [Verrucomicrobiota bacterium]